MRSRQERDALRKVAEIRALKLAAAEAQSAQAKARLSQESEQLERRKSELEDTQEHWQQSVSSQALRLEIAPLWGQTVQKMDTQFQQARGQVDRATSAQDAALKALGVADQTAKLADRLARRAAGSYRRDLEEAALNDAADRHLQHGRKL